MTDFPNNIARKAIVDFAAYSARGGATGALHLDANESPYAPPPVRGAEGYNRYPEQQPLALVQRLADLYGTTPERLMVGRGADEAIEVLLRTFIEDGKDSILICSPTFGYYKTCAQIQGADIIDVPLTSDYEWDTDAIIEAAGKAKNLKVIFLCTPNNPTGTVITDDLVEHLCAKFPNVLIAVDEAYEEFSSTQSYISKVADYPNLIVMRTLSKAYALAGVRGGVAIADPRVIDLMLKVLPPYPIARPVEDAILAALSPAAMSTHAARLTEWLSERERMFSELQKSPFIKKVWPSEANFLLIDVQDDDALMRELSRRNVKIRDYRSTTGHMRISIGSPEENSIALAAFGVGVDEKRPDRIGEMHRKTKETDISVRVNLDDASLIKVDTGIGFYDHMLEALAKHGNFGLSLTCKGDLEIDAHHTVEDCALALGTALKQALGDKAGIGRFGFVMPMDESQARVAVDLSGRPAMTFKGEFPTDHVGEFPSEMCPHVFESLAQTLGAAIQIEVEGENSHHMIEASFKGVARALRPAFAREGTDIASTKGVI
jgi:histidinol-phosphate aminotransferase/imidazoleglycerol-phosphate dehydratase/histidinol-phosphatase